MATVEMKEARFTFFKPTETQEEIEKLLEKASIEGRVVVTSGRGIRGSDKAEKITVGCFDSTSITLNVQLAGKNTRQQVHLSIPDRYRNSPDEMRRIISEAVKAKDVVESKPKKASCSKPEKDQLDTKATISADNFELAKLAIVEILADSNEIEKSIVVEGFRNYGFEFCAEDALDQLAKDGFILFHEECSSFRLANAQPEDDAPLPGNQTSVCDPAQVELAESVMSSETAVDHLNWLRSIAEKAKSQKDLTEKIHRMNQEEVALESEIERITLELQSLKQRKEDVRKGLEELGDVQTEMRKIREALGML